MAQTTSVEGLQLLSQGDLRSARDIFSSLVANKQELAQANYGLGVIALMEHNPSLARHHFDDCLNYDPQHSNALFQLGFIEKQAGNDQGAAQFWERCLQANPRHVGALTALGLPEPQSQPPLPPPVPPQTFNGTSPGEAIGGYDLYGLLKRCNSPIELEIVRLLDEIQAMIASKRQRISAFAGPFLLLWIVALGMTAFLASQRGSEPVAMIVLVLALVVTIGRVLEITCNKVECERYVFTQTKGVFATRSRNDHLWLMSRDLLLVKRSLFNRLTNDGSLFLGAYTYKGFFSGSQLRTIQKSFSQLKVIMPTNREVLAAIGELKQMRTGDK